MAFRLRDHLYWCECAGRIVFLDLEADSYFALPSGARQAFVKLIRTGAAGAEAERLRPLADRGFLVEDGGNCDERPGVRAARAAGDYVAPPVPRAAAGDLLRALAAEARWTCMLRFRPLRAVVEAAGRQRRGLGRSAPEQHERVVRIVAGAAAAALVAGAADRCLVRALAVHAACRRRSIGSRLVFGVRLHPFRAHCWVQLQDRVLVGDFEQVRLFTPIAAFG